MRRKRDYLHGFYGPLDQREVKKKKRKAFKENCLFLFFRRPGIPKVVIVMTDGRQTQEPDAMALDAAATAIHNQGAHLLVVGVGPKLSMSGLRMIAQYPSNIFTVQSFENLASTMQDVVKSACGGSEPCLVSYNCCSIFSDCHEKNLSVCRCSR